MSKIKEIVGSELLGVKTGFDNRFPTSLSKANLLKSATSTEIDNIINKAIKSSILPNDELMSLGRNEKVTAILSLINKSKDEEKTKFIPNYEGSGDEEGGGKADIPQSQSTFKGDENDFDIQDFINSQQDGEGEEGGGDGQGGDGQEDGEGEEGGDGQEGSNGNDDGQESGDDGQGGDGQEDGEEDGEGEEGGDGEEGSDGDGDGEEGSDGDGDGEEGGDGDDDGQEGGESQEGEEETEEQKEEEEEKKKNLNLIPLIIKPDAFKSNKTCKFSIKEVSEGVLIDVKMNNKYYEVKDDFSFTVNREDVFNKQINKLNKDYEKFAKSYNEKILTKYKSK